MKLTDENQDSMDCRPPREGPTGVGVPEYLEKLMAERLAEMAKEAETRIADQPTSPGRA